MSYLRDVLGYVLGWLIFRPVQSLSLFLVLIAALTLFKSSRTPAFFWCVSAIFLASGFLLLIDAETLATPILDFDPTSKPYPKTIVFLRIYGPCLCLVGLVFAVSGAKLGRRQGP